MPEPQREDRPRSRRGRAVVAAALTLLVGLVITGQTALLLRNAAQRDAAARFSGSATQTAASVEREAQRYFDKLGDLGAFVANDPTASQAQFRGYVDGAGLFTQLPSLVGVFYVARVEDQDLTAFVAEAQRANPSFAVAEIGPRVAGSAHYLLTYYVPGRVDLALPIGTDVSAIPSVTGYMNASVPSGAGVVGSFQDDPYLQQIAKQTSFPMITSLLALDFFIGVPVYARPVPAGRRPTEAPIGFVGATVADFRDVAAAATNGLPEDLGLSMSIDLTRIGLGDRPDLSRVAPQLGAAGPREQAAFTVSKPFQVKGVEWDLEIWSTADADAVPVAVPVVLLAGIAGSLLAAASVYVRLRARDRERLFAAEIADRESFQRDILASVTNPMVVIDADGMVVHANPAWTRLRTVQQERRDAPGGAGAAAPEDPAALVVPAHPAQGGPDTRSYFAAMAPLLRTDGPELTERVTEVLDGRRDLVELDLPLNDGARHRWFSVRASPLRGRNRGAVIVHTDITERKRTHDELELKATHDALTGLLNRRAFESEVDAALTEARLAELCTAVVFIDLDGFKPINDTFGHAVGDDVLRAVAQRITSAVRTSDRAARLGGDEFVVLISPFRDPEIAEVTADRILRALSAPVVIGDRSIPLAASVGVAVADAPLAGSHASLIEQADRAMYASKQQGGNRTTSAS
jgi:diguanylate cyclase (GGDEF)-like protein